MNEYEIRVNNAVIRSKALDEWSALKILGIFANIGDMIDFVRTSDQPETRNGAWIYEVELNDRITISYIKRVG